MGARQPSRPLTAAQKAQVEALLPLVDRVVNHLLGHRLPALLEAADLWQWAAEGLIHAVQTEASRHPEVPMDVWAFGVAKRVLIDRLRTFTYWRWDKSCRCRECVSLATVVCRDGGQPLTLAETIPDAAPPVFKAVDDRDQLDRFLRWADRQQRAVLSLRRTGMEHKAIGKRLGVVQSRVSQLQKAGIESIRRHEGIH